MASGPNLLLVVQTKTTDPPALVLHHRQDRSTKESEVLQASTSMKGIAMHTEDMTLDANTELGDFGACRRR